MALLLLHLGGHGQTGTWSTLGREWEGTMMANTTCKVPHIANNATQNLHGVRIFNTFLHRAPEFGFTWGASRSGTPPPLETIESIFGLGFIQEPWTLETSSLSESRCGVWLPVSSFQVHSKPYMTALKSREALAEIVWGVPRILDSDEFFDSSPSNLG